MKRLLLAAALTLSSAPAAQACDFHFGRGFGHGYDTSDAYWSVVRERLAEIEREKAMESARASFLSRFGVTPDAVAARPAAISAEAREASAPVQQAALDDADRRSRPDASDR